MMTWADLHDLSEVFVKEAERLKRQKERQEDGESGGDDGDRAVQAKTPMGFANVVHLDANGERTTSLMRWGWPGPQQTDPSKGFKHLHARCETIDTRDTWAESFRLRRGMLLVPDFNEGEELPSGKTKQWKVRHASEPAVAIAVIFDAYENALDGRVFEFFAMVTTEPAQALRNHNIERMPALLPHDEIPLWLGEDRAPLDEIKAVLRPYEGPLVVEEPPAGPPPKPRREPKPDGQPSLF